MRYLVVLVLGLAGCATNWVQAGKTESDFNRDSYECERDGTAMKDDFGRVAMWQRCMGVRGWQRQ